MTNIVPGAIFKPTTPPRFSDSPTPGLLEVIPAAFRTARDDIATVKEQRLEQAYMPVMRSLKDKGYETNFLRYVNLLPVPFSNSWDTDNIWEDVQKERAKNPKFLSELGNSREEFEKRILTRNGDRAKDQRIVSRGSGVAGFIGGIAGGMTDPVNVGTMFVAPGFTTVGRAIAGEAIINAGIEAVQQVPLADTRRRMGEDLSAEEAIANVALAGIGGGLLGGGAKWAELKVNSLLQSPQEKALIKRVLPHLAPERQKSLRSINDLENGDMANALEGIVGRDNLSEDELATVDFLRREQEIDDASPFTANGEGAKVHREVFAETLQRIIDNAPPNVTSAVRPGPRVDRGDAPAMRAGAGVSTGGGTGRDILKQKIGVVESSGGKNYANPKSSARGLYQFVNGTWLTYYKRRFGSSGLSDSAILGKRRDQNIQNILMDDLVADNAAVLSKSGIPESAGNLYLAHFAGSGGAVKVHAAAPNAPIASVLGIKAVNANPFMKGWTAKDLIDWAHRKMGQRTAQGSGVTIRETVTSEGGFREALQREIDTAREEELSLSRALIDDKDDDISDAVRLAIADENLTIKPFDIDEAAPLPANAPPRAAASDLDAPAEILAFLPQLRQQIAGGISLNRGLDGIAKELGVDENAVRRGLQQLALDGEIRQNRNGAFARLSESTASNGPKDMLAFIASRGGLRDDEGHDLGTIFTTMRTTKRQMRSKVGGKKSKSVFMEESINPVRNKLVPGHGPLLRGSGNSIDDIGEALQEAGYFTSRPTEAEVLEALDRAAAGEKIYAAGDMTEVVRREQSAREIDGEEYNFYSGVASREWDIDINEEEFTEIRDLVSEMPESDFLDLEQSISLRVQEWVNRKFDDVLSDEWEEGKDDAYEILEDSFRRAFAGENRDGQSGSGGQGDVGAATGEGKAGSGAGRENAWQDALSRTPEETGPIDPAPYRNFDDPDGDGVIAVTESMDHDLRVQYDFAAPTPDQARTALERKGDGRMQSAAKQKAPGGDGGLFDNSELRDLSFRFNDETPEVVFADLMDEIEMESRMIADIESCL